MNDHPLVRKLAELRYASGYVFENGTPFYEQLGEKHAYGLVNAIRAFGGRIVLNEPPRHDAPSISAGMEIGLHSHAHE
jgi:hypothetical protein